MKRKKHYQKKYKKFKTKIERIGKEHDIVYIKLDKYPQNNTIGAANHSLRLSEKLSGPINGPEIILDIDKDGFVIGMEILYS